MRDFLDRSACDGYSPHYLKQGGSVFRSALTSKLLRERHVPRYIVAPTGYGKTMLALQYAETIFSFQNVYWIDCQSPCFLRDLDSCIIAERLCSKAGDALLVVFDDVPMLDPHRTSIFLNQLDDILDHGGEVLVACTPSCDSFSSQRDRMKIGSWDMLLTDEELRETRMLIEGDSRQALATVPYQRIPKLAWGEDADRSEFSVSVMNEELPDDMRACAFVMMVLGSGALSDLSAFVNVKPESLNLLERDYPHLGIDQELGVFHCLSIPLEDPKVFPGRIMSSVADGSCFSSKESLSVALADTLLAKGELVRACGLMGFASNLAAKSSWLIGRGEALLDGGCISPASDLFDRCAANERNMTSSLCAGELLRRLLLEDHEGAVPLAERILRKVDGSEGDKALAAFTLSSFSDEELPDVARVVLSRATHDARLPQSLTLNGCVEIEESDEIRLLCIAACLHSDARHALALQREWVRDSGNQMALVSALFVMRNLQKRSGSLASDDAVIRELGLLASEVGCCIEGSCLEDDSTLVTLPGALVVLECAKLSHQGVLPQSCFSDRVVEASRKMEMELFRQQKICRMKALLKKKAVRTGSSSGKMAALEKQSVIVDSVRPPLRVNLFGGMDVFVGSRRLDPSLFSRRKVRTLLALLVLNGGKEYSCERLIQLMWPGKPFQAGRNNLYVVWGELRHALELPDKSCPYLIKQQQGLRIDSDLLISDVKRFNDLCRTLLFESPSYGGWMHVHEQVMTDFSEDLLPSEDQSDHIVNLRTSYRNRLVDALVSASRRLADAGDKRNAVWFAHTAVMRAKTREDAYAALMYAQLAAGQRTAALETYFECSRMLSEELGIDPSAEVMRLYKMALESDDDWKQ